MANREDGENRNSLLEALMAHPMERLDRSGRDCPDAHVLAAFASRTLDGGDYARLERHAAGCALCQCNLAALSRAGTLGAPTLANAIARGAESMAPELAIDDADDSRRALHRDREGIVAAIQRGFRFMLGPFPLSVAINLALIMLLIITVHEQRGRELTKVNLEAGGGGGDEMRKLDMPEVSMPEVAAQPTDLPQTYSSSQAVALATDHVRSEGGGIGLNRGGEGVGSGHGPEFGGGFGGFVGNLRRNGLDVVLVIDGTDSMRLVMADVKARMRELVRAIHRMVPAARVGIVVYGGEGEPLEVQSLTLSPARLDTFLCAIQTKGGGEWEENTYGAMRAAVDQMDWKPHARKVIVLAGDAPPKPDKFAALLDLERKFRSENGTVSVVDPTAQEHQLFERELNIRVHREPNIATDPMPAFYQQARAAFTVIAHTGGGEMRSLEGDGTINQQVMIMAFGGKWQEEPVAYER